MNKTTFCKMLGIQLSNTRWSWGGIRPDGSIVLFVWADEARKSPNGDWFFLAKRIRDGDPSPGVSERYEQLELIKSGRPCYLALIIDKSGEHSEIGEIRNDYLFRGDGFEYEEGVAFWIKRGERIDFSELAAIRKDQ